MDQTIKSAEPNVLGVARTPLQLFNIIEACKRFHADKNINKYLILVAGSLVDLEMMLRIVREYDEWSEVKVVCFHGWRKKIYRWTLSPWLRSLGNINRLYIGMVTHVPLYVAEFTQPKSIVLVDDGNETLLIARQISQGCVTKKGKSVKILDQLIFFTTFDVSDYTKKYIYNDYQCFKCVSSKLPTRSDVLVIGSNLVGCYLKNENVLNQRLQQMKQLFGKGVTVWYAPHRYECSDSIENIKQLGFVIYSCDTILEYSQIQQGWLFDRTFSIRSTAVDTLQRIYGISGSLCRLPKSDFTCAEKWQECEYIWATHPSVVDISDISVKEHR